MDFQKVTLEQMPQRMVAIETIREAFDKCTPYDCPSRRAFAQYYPKHSWGPEPEDIPMEKVVRVFWHCMGHTEYLDRFIGFFAGVRVARYDVLKEYFVQAFVRT
jgi:hypothetical protein